MEAIGHRSAIAGIALVVSAFGALAQYPTKPIRIISPAPPGGGTELAARLIQPGILEALKQPLIIEPRGGAGGYIGSGYAAKSAPDGYTLLVGGAFTTITASLQKNPSYSPRRDLVPIAILVSVPNILVAGPSLKANSVAELMALAKANPGKLNMGSNGVGTSLHLSGELFKLRTGADLVHVPYKGWADCVTGLLGGHVDLMFDNLSTALPGIIGRKVRPLAVAGAARHRALPEVPTLAEVGVADAEVMSWFGVMAPAGTPQSVIDTLGRTLRAIADTAEFRRQAEVQGLDVNFHDGADAGRFWIAEMDKWEAVVKAAGLVGQ